MSGAAAANGWLAAERDTKSDKNSATYTCSAFCICLFWITSFVVLTRKKLVCLYNTFPRSWVTLHSLTQDRSIDLAVDHKGLNKFRGRSTEYQQLLKEVSRIVDADVAARRKPKLSLVP